jgi:TRAP-type C4-dicarboxylate transport system substrate-binding protein
MKRLPALASILHLTLGLTLLAAGTSAVCAKTDTPTTLRFATFLPPNGIFTGADGVMGRWAKAVEKDSGGLLKVEILPGGTLGAAGRDPSAQLKMVTDGIADLSFVIPTTTPGRFPDDNLFGLPVTESSLEGSLVFWRLHQAGLMRGYDDKSFVIIGLIVNPPNTLHSKQPINSLEDMKGKRMQSSGHEQQEVLRALGATPLGTVTVRDAAEAISRGVIDGTPKDWIALHSFRIADAAPYHVDIPLGSATIMIAMNRARYDALPPAARAAIDKNSGEVFVRMAAETFDRTLKTNYDKTKADPKHTIVTLPKDEQARWDQAIESSIAAWRAESPVNEKLWQAFLKQRTDVRRELGTGK